MSIKNPSKISYRIKRAANNDDQVAWENFFIGQNKLRL